MSSTLKLTAVVVIALAVSLVLLGEYWGLILWIGGGLGLGLALLCSLLHYATVRRMRGMSTTDLEQMVWRYEPEYFGYIGSEAPEVAEFKALLEGRTLPELRAAWRRMERSFVRLEHAAGHNGRPLIMDYYLDYSAALAELARRSA